MIDILNGWEIPTIVVEKKVKTNKFHLDWLFFKFPILANLKNFLKRRSHHSPLFPGLPRQVV